MARHSFIRIAVVTAVVCWCVFAHADQVVLSNGDTITGKIAKMENGKILFDTTYMGRVQIAWSAVWKVVPDKPLHVAFLHEDMEASSLETAGEVTTVHTTDDRALVLPRGTIQTLRSQKEEAMHRELVHPSLSEFWTASADAGLSMARGNSTTTTVNVGARAARVTQDRRLSLAFSSLYSMAGTAGQTQTTANAIRSTARYEINLDNRSYTFAFTNFDSDRVQKLDLRSVLGVGLGYRTVQKKRMNLDLFTGASYDHEVFQTVPIRQSAEMLIGQDTMFRINPRILVEQRMALYPNVTKTGDYRTSLDVGSTTKLNSWLGWQFSLNNVYVSNPPVGAKNNDMVMSTGLRVVWGKERTFQPKLKPIEFPKE